LRDTDNSSPLVAPSEQPSLPTRARRPKRASLGRPSDRRVVWLVVGLLVLVNLGIIARLAPQWVEQALGEQPYAVVHHAVVVSLPWPDGALRIDNTFTLSLREDGGDVRQIHLRLGTALVVEEVELLPPDRDGDADSSIPELLYTRAGASIYLRLAGGLGWSEVANDQGTVDVRLVTTVAAGERGPLTPQGVFLLYDDMWLPATTELAAQHTGSLAVVHPADLPVAASGRRAGSEPGGEAGTMISEWRWDRPLAGGITLVASPEYTVVADDAEDPRVLCYVFPTEAETAPVVADWARDCIDYFVAILGYPPPVPYQIVTAPRGTSMAQGTYGLTVFRDVAWGWGSSGVPAATWRYHSVVAHEIAHHWWGHISQVYHARGGMGLAEGMAEYWSVRALEDLGDQAGAASYANERQRRWSREANERSDNVPLSKLWITNAIFGTQHIAYLKGGVAMQALEWYVGREAFDQACRALIAACDYGLGTLGDLRAQIEAAAPDLAGAGAAGLVEFWTRWYDSTGVPEVTGLMAVAAEAQLPDGSPGWLLSIAVEQQGERRFVMRLPAEIRREDGTSERVWVLLGPERVSDVEVVLTGSSPPRQLRLDPDRMGLYAGVPALVTQVVLDPAGGE